MVYCLGIRLEFAGATKGNALQALLNKFKIGFTPTSQRSDNLSIWNLKGSRTSSKPQRAARLI